MKKYKKHTWGSRHICISSPLVAVIVAVRCYDGGGGSCVLMSTEVVHGRSEPDLLLPLDDQKTWASPRLRAGSQEACQPRGTKTIAQVFKSRLATLTGEVSAKDIHTQRRLAI